MGDDPKRDFARLRFVGSRYAGPDFPVEVLPELAAYRELVVAAARQLYLRDHPARKKVPRGFEKSFGLVLSHVDEGSSVPVLARVPTTSAMALPLADANYFDRARDLIEETARRAARGDALPEALSSKLSAKFGVFGRSLGAGETIYLRRPDAANDDAPYNADIRKTILLGLDDEYWEDFSVAGELTGTHRRVQEFQFLSWEDGSTSWFKLGQKSQFRKLVDWMKDETPVILHGRALYRRGGVLQGLEVDKVSLLEEDLGDLAPREASVPIIEQLDSIAQLQNGWLDGRGEAYDSEVIARVRRHLDSLIDEHRLPLPFVYPTPEREVRVEWPGAEWDVVVTFDRDAMNAWLLATAVDGDEELDESFLVARPRDLAKLAIAVNHLLKGGS